MEEILLFMDVKTCFQKSILICMVALWDKYFFQQRLT